ncbi:hypothetical protein FBUS_07008 [Fasciolopsis buskii]|uniref:Trematode PH-like domain-containing protein n=1 Tax=Fasciolopsis buskii TaxID=27845 RepID=A0A8E0VLL0_9TREM|nr:hypothetical protein FBUS_07008 [Fasciolopsis buski]
MSFKHGRPGPVQGSWSSTHTNESSRVQQRAQQLLYFECDIYTISRTLLRAYEDFSEERANQLFEKYTRKKVNRSVAHFLIDRINFQRKGAFGSKPFRKEVTYREIKYFFAWSARPEYFMFCVTDEKMRRKSYEIYRCDSIQDVHAVCAFVYKATNDTQFILRNELPVDVISQSLNEMDDSLLSLEDEVGEAISSRNDTLDRLNWNVVEHPAVPVDRMNMNERIGYGRGKIPRPESCYSKITDEVVNITRERPSSGPPVATKLAPLTAPSYSSLPMSRAIDVYSFYDQSPTPKPRHHFTWGPENNEMTSRTITIKRQDTPSAQKDFSAQSGVSLVTEATSPFLSTPGSARRTPPVRKVNTVTSPFEASRHSIASPNNTISVRSNRKSTSALNNFGLPSRSYVYQQSPVSFTGKSPERNVLYASSESFFDQPLSSDGPLYMYVTYVESDSQFGGSSTISRASTRTGTSRTMLDDTTDG